ncbi:hypothetical protein POM88_046701 [Heracleum sosnowskyi]|uniref:Uncharacterized protein n=1 Tax=Heracleum sosnowskyi TaxID=360622 RepID=A0AAD8H6P2_9APIA|nr:hypothetical protein POM88_046701 [Heracleum sosnowskyi]
MMGWILKKGKENVLGQSLKLVWTQTIDCQDWRLVTVWSKIRKLHFLMLIIQYPTNLIWLRLQFKLAVHYEFLKLELQRVGRGGGLEKMWKRSVGCKVVDHSNNHIDVHVMERSVVTWRLTCFYGFPERSRRQESWNFIRSLVKQDNIP